MRTAWTGCGTALVTPFTREGAVDEAGVRRLARRQIDAGIHFLVPCGTTGESPTLTEDERVRVVQLVVEEAAGRVPVLAGAGGYDTREVIHSAQRMKQAGAGGILSVTPYYNKPTPEGLFQHYSAIAGEVGLPIDVASSRVGSIPGTHTVGFDSPSETISLTHTARDRTGFARGALEAAKWVNGRRGWFSMRDVLGL